MSPERNLLIIHNPKLQAMSDWTTVRGKIHARAPDIEVRIADSSSSGAVTRRWQASRPSLVFSANDLGEYKPSRGATLLSERLAEEIQYERLTAAGVSTPRTIQLLPGMALKTDIWGDYVIVKPQATRAGSNLRLVPTEEVGRSYFAMVNHRNANRVLIKQYVHSVDEKGFPIEYRVLTMFGEVLCASCNRMLDKRPPLADMALDNRGIPSSDATKFKRHRTLVYDEDVLALARAAATALSNVACLGIDILRDAKTKKIYVIEANCGGHIWNFSSERSRSYDPAFRRSLYTQFNALDLVADLLIEKTRAEAA